MLVHQMFVGHDQDGGIIPGRDKLLLTGQARLPSALLTADFEDFDPVANLGQVMHSDRTRASLRGAVEGFMLQRVDELLMIQNVCGCHATNTVGREPG